MTPLSFNCTLAPIDWIGAMSRTFLDDLEGGTDFGINVGTKFTEVFCRDTALGNVSTVLVDFLSFISESLFLFNLISSEAFSIEVIT